MIEIPLSRIGPGQLVDVEHSGSEIHDEFFRTCTVLQGNPPVSDIGDTTPFNMTRLYGGAWGNWNRHFIVQVAGCPFDCWYCYVDNREVDKFFSLDDIIDAFVSFRKSIPDLNVFHLMGGCPGKYSHLWKTIRQLLDDRGLDKVLFLSDVILVENHLYREEPWNNIPKRSIVSVCLKGSSFSNFLTNTGKDMFAQAMYELGNYRWSPRVHFSALNWATGDGPYIQSYLGKNVDLMKVKEYEVVKRRQK